MPDASQRPDPRALRDRPLSARTADLLAALLDRRETPLDLQDGRLGSALKPGLVHRVGDEVVKLYPRERTGLARLRGPRARRAVWAAAALWPVPTPQPLSWRTLDHPDFESAFVYRFAAGPTLRALWIERSGDALDPGLLDALPLLLAQLLSRDVIHADLHAQNLVWEDGPLGSRWVVLDLDGVRHRLHTLRRRALVEATWSRLLFDFGGADLVRSLFDAFLTAAGLRWNADQAWSRVEAGHRARLEQRRGAGRPDYPPGVSARRS